MGNTQLGTVCSPITVSLSCNAHRVGSVSFVVQQTHQTVSKLNLIVPCRKKQNRQLLGYQDPQIVPSQTGIVL